MKYTLEVTRYFDAAHFLRDYVGKCSKMHGHTYKVTVVVGADKLFKDLVMDFSIVKPAIDAILPDHKVLNEVYDFNPTAENLAEHFYNTLAKGVLNHPVLAVIRVKVWEGRDSCATYEG